MFSAQGKPHHQAWGTPLRWRWRPHWRTRRGGLRFVILSSWAVRDGNRSRSTKQIRRHDRRALRLGDGEPLRAPHWRTDLCGTSPHRTGTDVSKAQVLGGEKVKLHWVIFMVKLYIPIWEPHPHPTTRREWRRVPGTASVVSSARLQTRSATASAHKFVKFRLAPWESL